MSDHTFVTDLLRNVFHSLRKNLERISINIMCAVYRKAAYRIAIDLSPLGVGFERRLWDESFERRLEVMGIPVLPRLFRMTGQKEARMKRPCALLALILFAMREEERLCGPDWSVTLTRDRSGSHIRWEGNFNAELPPEGSLLRVMLSLQKSAGKDWAGAGRTKAGKGSCPPEGMEPEGGSVIFHQDRIQAQRAAQQELDEEMAAFLEQD